jgi:hypothetical protein
MGSRLGWSLWREGSNIHQLRREAFLEVPRKLFMPDTIWVDEGPDLVPLRRAQDPQGWRRRVYGRGYIVT